MKVISFVIILIILFSGCTTNNENTMQNDTEDQGEQKEPNGENTSGPFRKELNCKGEGTVNISSPMKFEDIGVVIPMGLVVGDHVTPIDHMYFQPTIFHSAPDTYNVYANADGIISSIGIEPENPANMYKKINVRIMHTCDFYSIYNLLTSMSSSIVDITGEMSYGDFWSGSIPIKKGDFIGKIGGQTLDLSVNYEKITLDGFIVPEHYIGESWKLHTVDPFDYFEEPDRSQLIEKNVRTALPIGGKIDYDIDGRLVGNWFVEGSGGYPAEYVPDVWRNHLSFVYDHIDPTHIIISMGNYGGESKQSAVKGNSPDPKDVSVSTGLVKYELVVIDYVLDDGSSWDRMSVAKNIKVKDSENVEGVVLAQLISERKLKFEAFPGKDASQISGFTQNAVIYER